MFEQIKVIGNYCRGLDRKARTRNLLIALSIVLISGFYLGYSYFMYDRNARAEAINLANSVSALLCTDHLIANGNTPAGQQADDNKLIDLLSKFVVVDDRIYYAYVLRMIDDEIRVIADSSKADAGTHADMRRNCEETVEINRAIFTSHEAMVTPPIKTACGYWVRTLVPILDHEGQFYGALGLSYDIYEWRLANLKNLLVDILIVLFIWFLFITSAIIYLKNKQLRLRNQELYEAERSKSTYLSQIPGMAYSCDNDQDWTMHFVSDGCYNLTGYQSDELLENRVVSFNDLILEEYRDILHEEWERILVHRGKFISEYQIKTKDNQVKWVLEFGQGHFDEEGALLALEGIVFDISIRKQNELRAYYLEDHDFLTGLYNRNYLNKKLNSFDHQDRLPLSILICDIDGLRMINSAYNFQAGDYVIKIIGEIIQSSIPETAVAARMGGGEFIVLLPKTDFDQADALKRAIKQRVSDFNWSTESYNYNISLSIGYATRETVEENIADVIANATEHLNKRKLLNQQSAHSGIVSSIMATLYAKSQETEEHGVRLSNIARAIGENMGLSTAELDDLVLLSQLHDIGKIGIDDRILNKPGPLNETEWVEMKRHPQIGYEIAKTTPQLSHIAYFILTHHEWWDGSGYPVGLKADEIPLISRILAVADAYDAMTEDRIYRRAISHKDAVAELIRCAGTQFDPDVVAVFVELVEGEKRSF